LVSLSIAPVDFFRGSGGGAPNPFAASSDDEEANIDDVVLTTKAWAGIVKIAATANATLVEAFMS
jgi:hypothetical protein